MIENRMIWQDLVFSRQIEGGVSNRPLSDDPDGLTAHGITRGDLAAFRGVEPKEVTDADLLDTTLEEAKAIASVRFWSPMNGDRLVGGLDVAAADFAFHHGAKQATKTLQDCLGFTGEDRDGFLGVNTLKAIEARDPRELIGEYIEAQIRFLATRPDWDASRHEWTQRCEAMRALALSLAPHESAHAVAATDGTKRNITAWAAAVATAATSVIPGILEALPAAKDGYASMADALMPFEAAVPWLVPVAGAGTMLGILFLAVRARSMAANAAQAGATAVVVAPAGPSSAEGKS